MSKISLFIFVYISPRSFRSRAESSGFGLIAIVNDDSGEFNVFAFVVIANVDKDLVKDLAVLKKIVVIHRNISK